MHVKLVLEILWILADTGKDKSEFLRPFSGGHIENFGRNFLLGQAGLKLFVMRNLRFKLCLLH